MKTQLNKDNIGSVQEALVKAYKELDLSSGNSNPLLYKPFKKDDAPICIYTDGIQKFSKELNGSYARTADSVLNITNAPISLHEI